MKNTCLYLLHRYTFESIKCMYVIDRYLEYVFLNIWILSNDKIKLCGMKDPNVGTVGST